LESIHFLFQKFWMLSEYFVFANGAMRHDVGTGTMGPEKHNGGIYNCFKANEIILHNLLSLKLIFFKVHVR
jgi:hypothetical protein